jgi:amidase
MSVPLAWSPSGLPIGAMFSARKGDDGLLFELALELEAARPWASRKPGVRAI